MPVVFDDETASQAGGKVVFDDEKPASDWSDLPKNIGPDASVIGQNALNTGMKTAKGIYDLPSDLINSGSDILSGKSPMETPIGQDVKATGNSIYDAVAGIPKSLENLGSKEEWIQHPVGNAINAAGIAAPLLSPETEGMAASLGKTMGEKGGNMASSMAETAGNTIRKINPESLGEEAQKDIRMAGNKPNVADIRTESGKKLVNDNVVGGFGQDLGDRLQKSNQLQDQFGQKVRSSLEDVKKLGVDTAIDAKPVLNPILDKWAKVSDSTQPRLAKPYGDIYGRLEKRANANGGTLSFDDIDAEMHDEGLKEAFKKSPDSPAYQSASSIYGILAKTRDNIVNQIADKSGNPKLANDLKTANQGYSFYSKVGKDMDISAASGEEPENMGRHMARGLHRGNPAEAVGYLGILQTLNALSPVTAQKLVKWGPGVQKYGGILESAAKKGARNLATADYVLKQQDPDYAEAMK